MNKKVLNMKDKYSIIYQFMSNVLGMDENEAIKNSLKLENTVSDEVLKRLKSYLKYTNAEFFNNPEYVKEFNRFFFKEKNR